MTGVAMYSWVNDPDETVESKYLGMYLKQQIVNYGKRVLCVYDIWRQQQIQQRQDNE